MSEMTDSNTEQIRQSETTDVSASQTPALTVSVSAQDRFAEMRNLIPEKKVVSGKIRYYAKGLSCPKFGLEHDYQPVPGKKWAKCPRCNSTRTIKVEEPVAPVATETPASTEVSA